MKSCQVIAHYLPDGKINPIRVKLNEGDEEIVFSIKRVLYTENLRSESYIKFGIEFALNNTLRKGELRFYSDELIWYIKI